MNRFRGNVLGMLSLLIIQFVLGMAVNLFITITRNHPGTNSADFFAAVFQSVVWAVSQGPIVLILHAILGLLLFINSIFILISAYRLPSTAVRVLAVLGTLGIIAAGINGASFLSYNQDANSFVMSITFALAAVVYTQILYMMPALAPDAPRV
ncbi:MAG: hypothetical protein ACRDFX_12840 [Chloroflexota bacterium]